MAPLAREGLYGVLRALSTDRLVESVLSEASSTYPEHFGRAIPPEELDAEVEQAIRIAADYLVRAAALRRQREQHAAGARS